MPKRAWRWTKLRLAYRTMIKRDGVEKTKEFRTEVIRRSGREQGWRTSETVMTIMATEKEIDAVACRMEESKV